MEKEIKAELKTFLTETVLGAVDDVITPLTILDEDKMDYYKAFTLEEVLSSIRGTLMEHCRSTGYDWMIRDMP